MRHGEAAFLACVVGLVWAGCPRITVPAADVVEASARTLGEGCVDAAQCGSGHCEDGVCCAAACREYETCALEGLRGTCVARPLGASCRADTQCPTGHCAPEGVCCNVECAGRCQTCVLPGLEGQCETARDNTDPGDRCGGACTVCFSGQCAPALVGTNPETAPGERACGTSLACDVEGGCQLGNGERCNLSSDCASGSCVAGICLSVSAELVDPPGMLDSASYRRVQAVGVRGDGTPCVVMEERAYDQFPTFGVGLARYELQAVQLVLACREPSGWRLVQWYDLPLRWNGSNANSPARALQVRLGGRVELLAIPAGILGVIRAGIRNTTPEDTDFPVLEGPPDRFCRFGLQWFHANGVKGVDRCIMASDQLPGYLPWSNALMSADGVLHLLVAREGGEITHFRCPDARCETGKAWTTGSRGGLPGASILRGGSPVGVDIPLGGTDRLRFTGEAGTLAEVDLPALGCTAGGPVGYDEWINSAWHALGLQDLGARGVRATVQCSGSTLAIVMDTSALPWTVASSSFVASTLDAQPVQPHDALAVVRPGGLSLRVPGMPDREDRLDLGPAFAETDFTQETDPPAALALDDQGLPAFVVEQPRSVTFTYEETVNGTEVRRFVKRPVRSVWFVRTRPDERAVLSGSMP